LTLNHHKGMQEKLAKHYENSTTGSKIKWATH
jgi:hypothetical protein